MKNNKIIIDTNLLVAAFFNKKSASFNILAMIRQKKLDCFYNDKIKKEARLILGNIKKSLGKRKNAENFSIEKYLDEIFLPENKIEVKKEPQIIKDDPDDNKFLAVAEIINADFIISNDHHLLDLKKYKNTKILSSGNFLKINKLEK